MAPTKNNNKTTENANRFKCPKCKKQLTDQSSFYVHMQLHTEDYPYSCDICSYKCKIKKYLSRHKKKVHTKADGPQCSVCGKKFHYSSGLKSHMRVHTGEKPYKCKVCGKAFSSTYCLSMHKLIHTNEKPFQCKFCEYACRDNSTLRRHEDRHQGIFKTYPCSRCKKVFKTSFRLRQHTDEVHYGIDTRVYICGTCEKGFKSKAALRLHIRMVHEKADRVECDICNRIVCKNNLGLHLKSHIDIRPYACLYADCGKCFKDRSSLKKHTLIHFPEKQYQCDMCECRFPRKFRLRQHRLRHEGSGYTCDYCLVSFPDKISLRTHIKREHMTISKKYICDQCGLIVYYKKEMVYHTKYGHGTDEDKKCRICSNVFKNTSNLQLHYMRMHKVRYVIQKRREESRGIKQEPLEECEEFLCNYDIQKVEIDENDTESQNSDTNMLLSERIEAEQESRSSAEVYRGRRENDSDSDAHSITELYPEYADTETTLAYSQMVLQEEINRSIRESYGSETRDSFEEFFNKIMDTPCLPIIDNPEYADTESTLAYSEMVYQDDIIRCLRESQETEPRDPFEEFFKKIMDSPDIRNLQDVDTEKLAKMKDTIDKMLGESRIRREVTALEKLRRMYNRRIKMATKNVGKKEPKQIKYFTKRKQEPDTDDSQDKCYDQKPLDIIIDNIKSNYDTEHENDTADEVDAAHENVSGHENDTAQEVDIGHETESAHEIDKEHENVSKQSDTAHGVDDEHEINSTVDKVHESDTILGDNETHQNVSVNKNDGIDSHLEYEVPLEVDKGEEHVSGHENYITLEVEGGQVNDTILEDNGHEDDTSPSEQEKDTAQSEHENDTIHEIDKEHENDTSISKRLRVRKVAKINYGDDIATDGDRTDDDYVVNNNSDKGIINKNGKLTFDGHECYKCFRLFKTKSDLKRHCTEHFDICNDTMLKKCPYCPYVTSKALKRHIEHVHKKYISSEYGHVVEKTTKNGPKYVFDIGNNYELEVIPSISNLNKIACMKIDEKNRKSKNLFLGKTKLVKKGGGWVVEKEAVSIDSDYLLPAFSIQEYEGVKLKGDSYLDRIKKLAYLAKKRGAKMLYPCIGCDKICQTMSALKLHNRKHEENPKMFRPKVWKNRKIEYKTKNRKNKKNKNANRRPVTPEATVDNRKNKPSGTENRFLAPQPVKNKHKCDKELIDFYKNNIKGGDIEFWQFLKIFNKMSRENINDFKDLENRNDTHFGIHFKEPVTTVNESVSTENQPVSIQNQPVTREKSPVSTVNKPVITDKSSKTDKDKKICNKKFTRAIMISKREYMRRNELKNEMRKRIAENRA